MCDTQNKKIFKESVAKIILPLIIEFLTKHNATYKDMVQTVSNPLLTSPFVTQLLIFQTENVHG
jgi:hypothetical protein